MPAIAMYSGLNEAAKIVVLSTFDHPRNLSEISRLWFGNKTRFYLGIYSKQISDAVKKGILVKDGNTYSANTDAILKEAIKSIKFELKEKKSKEYISKYIAKLEYFYLDLGEYTVKTYLNLGIIKTLSGGKPQTAAALDLKFLIQLPFVLRYIEYRHKPVFSLLLPFLSLNDYYSMLVQLERENMHILEKKKLDLEWAGVYRYVINSYYPQFVAEDHGIFHDYLKSLILKGGGK